MKDFRAPRAPFHVPAGPSAWSFVGEIPAGFPARFTVPDPEHESGHRRFDCELLAAMCAAYIGVGFSPSHSA